MELILLYGLHVSTLSLGVLAGKVAFLRSEDGAAWVGFCAGVALQVCLLLVALSEAPEAFDLDLVTVAITFGVSFVPVYVSMIGFMVLRRLVLRFSSEEP
jgi:hypothetical protein